MPRSITDLIHHPYVAPAGFNSTQPGVYKASTIIFPTVAAWRARDWEHKTGYTYGLNGTPTTFVLEERLASLEGGAQCLLVPSGLAALAHVNLSLLSSGDEVLIPDNAYVPLKELAEAELAHWGISHQVYDPMDPADLASRIGPRTRLVWLEAPGSITLEFPPLADLVRACRDRGVMTALDNTWGAGIAFSGFELEEGLGVDIVVHALTKYPSGGADVLMGSVVTREQPLHLRLKYAHMRLGWGVSGNDAEAVLRSLPSLALRYRAQDAASRQLAAWMAGRTEVMRVFHPALEGSPGHANWRALCGKDGLAAGLFSVVFQPRYSPEQVDAFCDALRLFKIGTSWGGPISLAVPYNVARIRRPGSWPHPGRLVRFAVGLEAADDLQADLEQALSALA